MSSKSLGDIIAEFRKKYPLVQFDLHSGNGYSVFDRIESETVLIWKKDCIFSTATSTFIEFIEQYLKGITDD